jgi:hypothetical protein
LISRLIEICVIWIFCLNKPSQSPAKASLQALVQEEFELTASAHDRLGSFVPLAATGTSLLNNSIASIGRDHFVVAALMIAMQKASTLAFLSYVRKHVAQAEFNCRQLIEFCALAAYLLAHPEIELGDPRDDSSLALAKAKALSGKAYKWLNQQHPLHSKNLLEFKGIINDTTAHASVYVSYFTFPWDGENTTDCFDGTFFDMVDDDTIRMYLTSLARLILVVIDTLRVAAKSHSGITFYEDLEQTLARFERDIQAHRDAVGEKMNVNKSPI